MKLDGLTVPYPTATPSEGEPAAFLSRAAGSALAFHEAGHVLVGRYFGLEVASVTIIPGAHYAGRVFAPGASDETSPEAQIAAVQAICAEARSLQPEPGEDPENYAVWAVHAHSRCLELLAGHEGERLRDPRAAFLSWETDLTLARLYASTICHPGAVAPYLHFAATEARAILKTWRLPLDALAEALEARRTLSGEMVDQILAAAVCEAAMRAEMARRQRMREAAQRAAIFLKEALGETLERSNRGPRIED